MEHSLAPGGIFSQAPEKSQFINKAIATDYFQITIIDMITTIIIITTITTIIIIVIDYLHLMAERLSMGDSNRTCSHKVTVGWAHLVQVIMSISCGSY